MIMVAVLLSLNKHSTNYAAIGMVHESLLAKQRLTMGTPWLYSPELLPLRLRAKGTAVATSFSWLCTFVVRR